MGIEIVNGLAIGLRAHAPVVSIIKIGGVDDSTRDGAHDVSQIRGIVIGKGEAAVAGDVAVDVVAEVGVLLAGDAGEAVLDEVVVVERGDAAHRQARDVVGGVVVDAGVAGFDKA